jgi:hypothetical protein
MILTANYARTHKKPYFGICLGLQVCLSVSLCLCLCLCVCSLAVSLFLLSFFILSHPLLSLLILLFFFLPSLFFSPSDCSD